MLNTERFFRTIVLALFFSFFLWSMSSLATIYLLSLVNLLTGTFLNSFVSIVDITLRVFFSVLSYISKIFFIGCLVGLISIFMNDFVVQPIKKGLTNK